MTETLDACPSILNGEIAIKILKDDKGGIIPPDFVISGSFELNPAMQSAFGHFSLQAMRSSLKEKTPTLSELHQLFEEKKLQPKNIELPVSPKTLTPVSIKLYIIALLKRTAELAYFL